MLLNHVFWGWLLLSCVVTSPKDTQDSVQSCDASVAALWTEIDNIRACESSAQCGQVLAGTSCGCTRDLVARTDADLSTYLALLADVETAGCDAGFVSTCDCPEADGYACTDGLCTWNYVEPPPSDWSVCDTDAGDSLSIDGMTVEADTLTVEVSYGGGCATHDFVICWPDQSFMESEPVQVALEIWHDGHDDPCDAVISETVSFALAPLQAAWQTAYGTENGTIIIHVDGYETEYSF